MQRALEPGEREVWDSMSAKKKNPFVNKFPDKKSGVNAEENLNEKRESYEVSHGVIDSGQAESEGSSKSKRQRIGNE